MMDITALPPQMLKDLIIRNPNASPEVKVAASLRLFDHMERLPFLLGEQGSLGTELAASFSQALIAVRVEHEAHKQALAEIRSRIANDLARAEHIVTLHEVTRAKLEADMARWIRLRQIHAIWGRVADVWETFQTKVYLVARWLFSY